MPSVMRSFGSSVHHAWCGLALLCALASCSSSNGRGADAVSVDGGNHVANNAASTSNAGGSNANTTSSGGSSGSNGSNTGGASAGTSSQASQTSTAGPDYPDIEFTYDPSKDVSPEVCAEQTITAEPLPLDMYLILDRSGTMIEERPQGEDCNLGEQNAGSYETKWCKATRALSQYFMSDAAAGHRAALQFMLPPANDNQTDIECKATPDNLHAQPEVPLTDLPTTITSPLVTTMESVQVNSSSTAIEAALNGLALYTASNTSPGRQMIGILVTDGDPTYCSEVIQSLARIPEDHFDATGIPTFIIGMTGADPAKLEDIASRGGGPEHSNFCDPTDPNPSCHYWSVADGDPTAFVAALQAIQDSASGCEFAVPTTDTGLVALDTVRVEHTTDQTSAPVVLSQVGSQAACTNDAYFTADVNGVPTIRLCPSACGTVVESSRILVTVECEGD